MFNPVFTSYSRLGIYFQRLDINGLMKSVTTIFTITNPIHFKGLNQQSADSFSATIRSDFFVCSQSFRSLFLTLTSCVGG